MRAGATRVLANAATRRGDRLANRPSSLLLEAGPGAGGLELVVRAGPGGGRDIGHAKASSVSLSYSSPRPGLSTTKRGDDGHTRRSHSPGHLQPTWPHT